MGLIYMNKLLCVATKVVVQLESCSIEHNLLQCRVREKSKTVDILSSLPENILNKLLRDATTLKCIQEWL